MWGKNLRCTNATKNIAKICHIDKLIFYTINVIIHTSKNINFTTRICVSKEKTMKLAKKILVAVLALALLASAFLFSATAEDTFNAPGMNSAKDILEYYTLDDYVADNYNNGTWTTELVKADAGTLAADKDPTNAENGVLGMTLSFNKKASYVMEAPAANRAAGLTDQLFLTFKIYFDESFKDNAYYELQVGTVNENGVVSNSQFTILQFNFSPSANKNNPIGFYYNAWNPATQSFSTTLTQVQDAALETGKWYDVVISANAAKDVYYFNVSDLEGNVVAASGDLSFAGAEAIWGFTCYGRCFKMPPNMQAKAKCYIDDMEIYEGSFVRYPSLKDEVTTTHLQDLDALYNAPTTDYETKYDIVTVLDYLYNEAAGFTVGSVVPNAQKYINETYAQAFKNAVDKIDTTSGYYNRLAYLDTLAFYDAKLPDAASLNGSVGITADLEAAIVAGRAAFAQERATLETIKAQSDAFIALMSGYDAANKDYTYVTALFTEATDSKYASRDITYEGVEAAEAIFADIKFKAERMVADVNAFVTAVDKMEAATTFGPLFLAYVEANASYTKYGTDAVINPDLDNSTKENLGTKIAFYESKVDEILATAFICDEFNRIIKEATISSYYTTLVGELEEAAVVRAQFGEYEMDYPGIAESVATYEAFVAAVAETKSAVEAYINAVNAIATKTTFADKKAAITAAIALKAEGDVLGMEGVVEANIALTAAEAEINFLEGNSTTLISLVEQIKAATTLSEKRELIQLANAAAENAEDTYTGVSAAKADLATAIAAFEADVAAANAALDSALKSAQAIAYSVG